MTERAAKARPRIELGTRELRAALVALLAGVYLAVWPQLRGPSAEAGDAPAAVATSTVSATPRTVWIDQLPPGERPLVEVPAGWTLASSSAGSPRELAPPATSISRPRIARATRSHARIRTRSS